MATSEQEMKEAFDTFDTDHTGTIHAADLGTVIRALGRAPLEKEIEAMLAEVGDSPINFEKFKALYRRKMRRPQELEKEMRQAFRLLDETGRGTISSADLRFLLGCLGEPLRADEVDSLMRCIESDAEGNVNYEELVDLMVN